MTGPSPQDYSAVRRQAASRCRVSEGEPRIRPALDRDQGDIPARAGPAACAPPKSTADDSPPGGAKEVELPVSWSTTTSTPTSRSTARSRPSSSSTGGRERRHAAAGHNLGLDRRRRDRGARRWRRPRWKWPLAQVDDSTVGGATVKDQVFAISWDGFAHIDGLSMPGMVGFETFRRFVTPGRLRHQHPSPRPTPNVFDQDEARRCTSCSTATPRGVEAPIRACPASSRSTPRALGADPRRRFIRGQQSARASKGVDAIAGWGIGGPTRSHVTRGGELNIGGLAAATVRSSACPPTRAARAPIVGSATSAAAPSSGSS